MDRLRGQVLNIEHSIWAHPLRGRHPTGSPTPPATLPPLAGDSISLGAAHHSLRSRLPVGLRKNPPRVDTSAAVMSLSSTRNCLNHNLQNGSIFRINVHLILEFGNAKNAA